MAAMTEGGREEGVCVCMHPTRKRFAFESLLVTCGFGAGILRLLPDLQS